MNNFLKYLFSPVPGIKFGFYTESLIFLAILITAAIVIKIIVKKYKNGAFKKHFGGAPNALILFAIFFGFIIFSRYEQIAFFGMRFMVYLLLAIFVYWAARQIYIFFTKYKEDKTKIKELSGTVKYSTKKHK